MMEDKNQIDDLFRKADASADSGFPMSDKVWARVEEKMENRQLSKSKNVWKKMAVAASVLLCGSIGFQIWWSESDKISDQDQFEVRSAPAPGAKLTEDTSEEDNKQVIVSDEKQQESASADASEKKQQPQNFVPPIIMKAEEVASENADAEVISMDAAPVSSQTPAAAAKAKAPMSAAGATKEVRTEKDETADADFLKRRKAPRMTSSFMESEETVTKSKAQQANKEPLYVINEKPVTGRSDREYARNKRKALSQETQLDSIIELKNPIYIIDGKQYSEEELFGENPTSPYAPLQKQEIEEFSMLKEAEAIRRFGEKGKEGVVIIKTKNGKPAGSR